MMIKFAQCHLSPATLAYTPHGTPYSSEFDDVYHSQARGLAQARAVYLAGNDLPRRWQGQTQFAICETGFGLGLNFLATWQAWRSDPDRCQRLHFASCELHPFSAQDLSLAHRHLLHDQPELLALSQQLRAQWPLLIAGMHRLEFEGGKLILTLILGDAHAMLPQLQGRFDAFYLDGFAPRKNPQLWQPFLFKQFARLSSSSATIASYSVATEVKAGLTAAGFLVEKRAGFGAKLHVLSGFFRAARPRPAPIAHKQALIIGAGLAGAAIAERLRARGWQCTILERQAAPALEASGNHAGVYRPVLSRDDNLQARLSRACYLYGLRGLARLSNIRWASCGVLQLTRGPDELARFADLPAQLGLPRQFAYSVNQQQASELAGQPLTAGGICYPQGAWINPPSVVTALLQGADCHYQQDVAHIRQERGLWQARDAQDKLIASAPVLILANAADAQRFAPELTMQADPRAVTSISAAQAPALKMVLSGGAYLTPAHAGLACIGASAAGEHAQAQNLALLPKLLAQSSPLQAHSTRICARPTSLDRMPIVGPLLDRERWLDKFAGSLHLAPRRLGLFALTGFGARGLVWSQLCAELLACQICDEPLPLERDLVLALDPARFLARHGNS